jgi:hypothetical protein
MQRTRLQRISALAAALLAAPLALLTPAPVNAVTGTAAADNAYAFTARLAIGEGDTSRACSGVLVNAEWLLTAASCFAANPAASLDVPAGAPALKTTATIGRTNLTSTSGQVRNVVELVPYSDPGQDVVLARLASPVTSITPVALSSSAPAAGEELLVAGYGRTTNEWAPLTLHTGTFTLDSVSATEVGITGEDGVAVCKGDTGGPLLREAGGSVQLVGINSRSWQGGCFGIDAAETRTSAVDTRVDTLGSWISSTVVSTLAPRHDFTDNGTPDLLARDSSGQLWLENTGYDPVKKSLTTSARRLIGTNWNIYTMIEPVGNIGGSAVGDLVARDSAGVLWFYEGKGDGTFLPRVQYGSGWNQYAELAAGGDLDGDGKADLVAADTAGLLWLYKGTGNAAAPYKARVKVGLGGWEHLDQLNLTGDIAGSSAGDLVARDTSGFLWLYEGKGDGTFLSPIKMGSGWSQYTHLTAIGDGNGDGKPDLYTIDSTGKAYFYAGTGSEATLFGVRSATPVLTSNWQSYTLII